MYWFEYKGIRIQAESYNQAVTEVEEIQNEVKENLPLLQNFLDFFRICDNLIIALGKNEADDLARVDQPPRVSKVPDDRLFY